MLDPARFEELKASGVLPSPKGVALAIMRMTQRDDVAVSEVVRVVKTDPALSGRIIKAANTGNLQGRRPVAAIPDAVVVLGLSTIRQLALGFSLVSSYRDGGCKAFDYDRFWSHSLVTAIAMQALTTRSRAAPPEETFVVGLLARVGCLALATLHPAEYAVILGQTKGKSSADVVDAERQTFAMEHNELSAALLSDWGLPKVLVEPVFHHESPEASGFTEGSRAFILTHSVLLATKLADLCLTPEAGRRALLPSLLLHGARLGLEADALTTLADQVVRDWQDWGPVLNIKVGRVGSFAELAKAPEPAPDGGSNPAAAPGAALKVLAIDDDRSTVLLLRKLLTDAGHTVFTASNGREGLAIALQENPHIIVTDWMMPELDGVSFCRALRKTKIGRGMYVLILTGLEDEERLIEAFEAGVDDYVVKPFNPRVLHARLRAGQRVIQLQQEIESDREEIRRFAAELAMTNRRLQQAALMDPLTEIPNRRYAMDRIQQEWAAAERNARPLACMLIDIDQFKRINDTYGHDAGDVVLRRTADTLRRTARTTDVICRIGGEEFLAICPNSDLEAAAQCAERLRAAVAGARVEVGNVSVNTTISIGVAAYLPTMVGPEAMIKAADQAVYAAKQAGRNRTCVVRPNTAEPANAPARG